MPSDITILLAEDEAMIADIMEGFLVDSGFDVVVAPDGLRTLEELEAGASHFRAVVTDIRLGNGPDGWEIARRARELSPTMPIIYTSGDSTHEWASKGVPGSVMLAKPFAPAQLVTALSMLLNQVDTQLPAPPE